MINLREFWQAAMANLRAIFSAKPAPPPRRIPPRALPGPVAPDSALTGTWTVQPPRQIEAGAAPPAEEVVDEAQIDAAEPEFDGPSMPNEDQDSVAFEPDELDEDAAATDSPGPETESVDKDALEPTDDVPLAAEAEPEPELTDDVPLVPEAEAEPASVEHPEAPVLDADTGATVEQDVEESQADAASTAPPTVEPHAQPPHTVEAMPRFLAELEALLFVAAEPAAPSDLARALDMKPEEIDAALIKLGEFYQRQGRGLRVQLFNDKVQLVTAPTAAPYIERFLDLDNTARLSGPALETLAVVAYRQPVTRAQIESVRGVDCAGVLRSLLQRNLIADVGRVDAPGRPILYGVTEYFMQHFGLTALEELPPLEEDDADRLWAATVLAEDEDDDTVDGMVYDTEDSTVDSSVDEMAVDMADDSMEGAAHDDSDEAPEVDPTGTRD